MSKNRRVHSGRNTNVYALLCSAVLGACHSGGSTEQRTKPPPAVFAEPMSVAEVASLDERVAFERFRLAERLSAKLLPPEPLHEKPCPDAELARLDGNAKRLVLASEDLRFEAKRLLPLALKERLLGADIQLTGRAARFSTTARVHSRAAAERELESIEEISKRRYRGTYYITDYVPPRLIRRPEQLRAQWVPGVLAAWFVVHDLENGSALCQKQLIVRNSVEGESTHRASKSAVSSRLIEELGATLREASRSELLRISSELRFPDTRS